MTDRTVAAAAIDLDAYLRRIGHDGAAAATLPALARLVRCHAGAIAFENIEVLAGRVPQLDAAALQGKLVQRRRGGYCFEQNTLFSLALRQLGFEVRGLEARVRVGVPADVVSARTHMALGVTVDGAEHLVDVGFGGLAPLAPLAFDAAGAQPAAAAAYRFIDAADERLLQVEGPDGWSDCYCIGATAPRAIDHELANWWVATHPKAMLRHNLLVGRALPEGRATLFNDRLSLRREGRAAPEERTLSTRADFAAVLADTFGLDIASADLDAVMAVVERRRADSATA